MQQLNGLNGGKFLFVKLRDYEVSATLPSGYRGLVKGGFRKSQLNGATCLEIGDATVLISRIF